MHKLLQGLAVLVIFKLLMFQTISGLAQTSLIVQHYTSENGLPAHGVQGLELDKTNGFVWVGTQAGLVRFDGHSFRPFLSTATSVTASRIQVLAQNPQGTIYCEDENYAVYRITNHYPNFETVDSSYLPSAYIRIANRKTSAVAGLIKFLRRHRPEQYLPDWIEYDKYHPGKKNFAIIYFNQGYYYDSALDRLVHLENCSQMLRFGTDFVYVSADGLWLLDKPTLKFKRLPDVEECKTGPTERKFLWKRGMRYPLFIDSGSLFRLELSGGTIQKKPICNNCIPANAEISSAQVWEEQNAIFLGSQVNGLYVLRMPLMSNVRGDTLTSAGRVEYSQAEVTPGLVSTASGLAYTTSGLVADRPDIRFPASNIFKGSLGDYWFSHGDTVFHFHTKAKTITTLPLGDHSDKIIFAESRKKIYVISDFTIAEITGDQVRPLYRISENIKALKRTFYPENALEIKPGILAIAADKLIVFDTRKRQPPDTIQIPGLVAKVRALQKIGQYLLIGTYGQGFYLYKDGVIKKMPLDRNGYLSMSHCFMLDDLGFCWISTNKGIFKVRVQSLLEAFTKDLPEIYYHYYGKNDGILNTELNGGCQPCGLRLSNGLMSFPSMNGMVLFDPAKHHVAPPNFSFLIESIFADTTRWVPKNGQRIAIPSSVKDLRFVLELPYFGNPENVYFSFKLDGYHTKWQSQDLHQNSVLYFGQLSPGTYTLWLRVRNGFGSNDFQTQQFRFTVLEPWFQSWWFSIIWVSTLIAAMWGIVKWRTARILKRKAELQRLVDQQTMHLNEQGRQLTEQLIQLESQQARLRQDNDVKARLVAIISHDMISPLKFINFMSRKLTTAFEENDPNYQTAGFIASIAQDLESLSVNILNWIRFHHDSFRMIPETFNVAQMVAQSVEIARTLAKEKGLGFGIEVSDKIQVRHFPQLIGIILYNLTINAVKYTESGRISVSANLEEDKLTFSVADNGVGMPEELVEQLIGPESFVTGYSAAEAKKYKFGYVLIKDLLKLSGGQISVQSTLGQGTTVAVKYQMTTIPDIIDASPTP